MIRLTDQQEALAREWLPAVSAGVITWLAFLLIGHTPLIRASGMALAVIGMAMALRSMGPALAFIGGVALAFSPSFWIQTGGAQNLNPLEVLAALIGATLAGAAILRFSKRPLVGAIVGIVLLAILFLTIVGTPRSLRLTTLLTAWTLYLLVDGLLVSNPRSDEPSNGQLGAHHTF